MLECKYENFYTQVTQKRFILSLFNLNINFIENILFKLRKNILIMSLASRFIRKAVDLKKKFYLNNFHLKFIE